MKKKQQKEYVKKISGAILACLDRSNVTDGKIRHELLSGIGKEVALQATVAPMAADLNAAATDTSATA